MKSVFEKTETAVVFEHLKNCLRGINNDETIISNLKVTTQKSDRLEATTKPYVTQKLFFKKIFVEDVSVNLNYKIYKLTIQKSANYTYTTRF